MSQRPAQVVTPVESMPSLTTNSVAMKMTTGSPKPATTCSAISSPVAHSASTARIATTPTGSRFQTNRTMTSAEDDQGEGSVIHRDNPGSEMDGRARAPRDAGDVPDDEEDRPRHEHDDGYGIIIDTTVPIPADFRYAGRPG